MEPKKATRKPAARKPAAKKKALAAAPAPEPRKIAPFRMNFGDAMHDVHSLEEASATFVRLCLESGTDPEDLLDSDGDVMDEQGKKVASITFEGEIIIEDHKSAEASRRAMDAIAAAAMAARPPAPPPAPANGRNPVISAAVRKTWKEVNVRTTRLTRHEVVADGVTYRSVREAFRALRLPDSKHIKFRGQLKNSPDGKLEFHGHTFELGRRL